MSPNTLTEGMVAEPLVPLMVPLINSGTAEPTNGSAEPTQRPINTNSEPDDHQDAMHGTAATVPLFGSAEIASLAGVSERFVRKAIEEKKLESQPFLVLEGKRKGKTEYRCTLQAIGAWKPATLATYEARQAIAAALATPPTPTPTPLPSAADLKDWQRLRMHARLAVLRYVGDLRADGTLSLGAARAIVIAEYLKKQLPTRIQELAEEANARGRALSIRTLERWHHEVQRGFEALAPKKALKAEPKWLHPFLTLWRQPQKPSIRWAVEQLPTSLAPGVQIPSYDTVYRYLDKVGVLEKQKGRMLDREIKAVKPFHRREKPEFPLDVWVADGHTFDAEVQHPVHGQPFRPEITSIVDVCTSKVVGWSVGLAEGAFVVVDALRHGILGHGVPAVFYTDNGPGYRNKIMAQLTTWLGIEHTFSIPYNSQARGVIERLHKTLYVEMAAKRLPTYIGADMDRQAKQIAFKATRKDGRKLVPWDTFVAFLEAVTHAYNTKPTAALPKLTDETTGRKRHLSPGERWQQALDAGWAPVPLESTLDEFRPMILRTAQRCEINCFGNSYYAKALEEFHGVEVRVAYDIHDATTVWVRTLEGALICEASFEANKSAYFPQSFMDQARAKREQGRLGRLQRQVDEIRAEAGPGRIKTLTASDLTLATESRAALGLISQADRENPPYKPQNTEPEPASEPLELEPPTDPDARPAFPTDLDYVRWVLANPDACDAEERASVQDQITSSTPLRLLLGIKQSPLTPFKEAL